MALRPPLGLVGFIALYDLRTAVVNAAAIPFRNAVTVNGLYIQTKKLVQSAIEKTASRLSALPDLLLTNWFILTSILLLAVGCSH